MRNSLIMKYPSTWYGEMWREAIPVGNGEIGGLVYGGIHHEIITLNHGKLWWKYKNQELPDVSYILPKMQKLLLENNVQEAENLMIDELIKKGYTKAKNAIPLSVCDIDIITHYNEPFKHYRRILNMENAEATVKWEEGNTKFLRSFFVSRANDTAFYKITSKGEYLYDASFTLKVHDTQTAKAGEEPIEQKTVVKDNFIYYSAKKDDGSDFGAVCKIKHNGIGICENNSIRIKASQIELAVKVFIDTNKNNAFKEIENKLRCDFSYDDELKIHSVLHSKLFNKTTFSLGNNTFDTSNEELLLDAYEEEASNELIEKLWSFGRYLLVCASRQNGYPCQLYGLWCGDYNPMWPWNMFNVNVQIIYWHALSGNIPEVLLSLFDYLENFIDDFRENARKLYNCRGINICSVNTPESGLHKFLMPHILHWTGGAGWMAQHYYDYWLCTRDMDFLKNHAMPFMYEALLFYEDFLLENEDGYYVIAPSTSPENVPRNVLYDLKCNSQIVVNSTMDFAILKELLTNIIEGSSITGLYTEKQILWREMLEKIPNYNINDDGAVSEWMHPFYEDNYEHRHESHLYPVFPGTEITAHNNPKLYNAFKTAVDKRKVVGLKDQSGWSLVYMANSNARLKRGNEALEALNLLTRSNLMNNFFSLHNDWRRMGIASVMELISPVQLDANMGFTSAINEMLIFSTANEVHIFNAMPEKWSKGFIGPLLSRTNTEITLKWDKTGAKAIFKQLDSDTDFELILPKNMYFDDKARSIRVHLSKNETKEFNIKIQ